MIEITIQINGKEIRSNNSAVKTDMNEIAIALTQLEIIKMDFLNTYKSKLQSVKINKDNKGK